MINLLVTLFVIVALWSLVGYFSSRVEQAEYTVLKEENGYEIREYPAHLVAQTTVEGSYQEALNAGFKIVAGYIFGGNTKKESIAMTAPVSAEALSTEKIAMTAPVTARAEGGARVISFVMPKSYTRDTLPTPNDSRVKIVEVPAKKVAALRFSWGRSTERVKKMETHLQELLARDNVAAIGTPSFAGYNAPWTPPWMIRNEILIEI